MSNESTESTLSHDEENQLIAQRKEKLIGLRERGFIFPNQFKRTHLAEELHQSYDSASLEELTEKALDVQVAGRIMLKRIMGKISFVTLQDMSGQIQLVLQKDRLGEDLYMAFKDYDIGDIVGVAGQVSKTKKGELSIKATELQILTKSLRPLPEKWQGLADAEIRARQRYLDLIVNPSVRQVFQTRSAIIRAIRDFFNERNFLEVETPMMHIIPGGATARPFVTHHNTLDMNLYLRIAPELFLKRLVVGGFERVFEINRSFRNEGLSSRHNPEFTMIEFYQAYAAYEDLMDLTETLFRELASKVLETTNLTYQGETFDLSRPFARLSVKESIVHYLPEISRADLEEPAKLKAVAEKFGVPVGLNDTVGMIQFNIFEKEVESKLREPTFITHYPIEVSPLARRNDRDPTVTDRFEFFMAGREIANGFSELNDAIDQAERFRIQSQAKDQGDLEAMHYDADYVRALEFGMPPTAGEGIGIDRLVMLFTDSESIRDVLLFPHMRREA